MDLKLNSLQTDIEALGLKDRPQEIQDQFYSFLDGVPFIRSLVSPDRPYAKDLPRDSEGKIVVDITRPHILEDMDYFRPAAIHFQKYGCYTDLRPNRNPNSEFGKWFREEVRRCREGYVRPSDGEWVTGDYYFFLNYTPMLVSRTSEGSRFAQRVIDFPSVWEGHYYKSHYLDQARKKGLHAAELSRRGCGKSFFGAALLAKRFLLGESEEVRKKVVSYIIAFDKAKLIGGDQTLDKFQYDIDFCTENTQFPSKRLLNSIQNMQWQSGYLDLNSGAKKGTLNSVIGKAYNDASKLRGSRGVLYLFEEAGSFPNLLESYNNLLPSVEDGSNVFGTLYLYGCVCAGTTVLDPYGRPIKIEDISIGDVLLGYDGEKTVRENIIYTTPVAYKECVRIYTEKGNYIDCSTDHPLLVGEKKKGEGVVSASFYKADELKVGDMLLLPQKTGVFGDIHVPYDKSFLLGALFGDGSYSGIQCVTLSITSEEEYEYYNAHFDVGISKIGNTRNGGIYAQLYFRNLHPMLQKYGMDGQAFENKRLPEGIFEWDRESVAAFLSGYFNADGNIQIVKKKHRSIKLTCKYRNILEQIKWLLMKFGINSHIYEERRTERLLRSEVNGKNYKIGPCICYVLYISNAKDVLTFRDNFKFLLRRKQERLDSFIPCKKSRKIYSLPFKMRSNGKGKYYENKRISDVYGVVVKKVEPLGIQRIYNLTANTTHTYITNGFISSNTSGDEQSDFAALQEIMYNPKGYHVYGVDNVYDMEGQGRRVFTSFFPGYLNRANCYDENGNSDVTKALLEILEDRYNVKYNSTDVNSITKRIAEIPITPQEAILRTRGNLFPVTDLSNRLNEIDNNPRFYDDVYTGSLVMNSSGAVEYVPSDDIPIREFPLKDSANVNGAVEIYALPEKNSDGKIPFDRYVAGLDPIEDDESGGNHSLMSLFILDLWTDRIVYEYTGRHPYADDCYEEVRKALLFYNARCLYESNVKGIFAYFSKMNCLYLLADTPEYLRDKDLVKIIGYGNKSKGYHATQPLNNYADTLIRNWLIQPVTLTKIIDGEEQEVTMMNLYRIKNRALLKEAMLYNSDGNFDRIRALGACMLYREEKMIQYQGNFRRDDRKSLSYKGNDDFFTRNYEGRFHKFNELYGLNK